MTYEVPDPKAYAVTEWPADRGNVSEVRSGLCNESAAHALPPTHSDVLRSRRSDRAMTMDNVYPSLNASRMERRDVWRSRGSC
jgi:hypothetical protein